MICSVVILIISRFLRQSPAATLHQLHLGLFRRRTACGAGSRYHNFSVPAHVEDTRIDDVLFEVVGCSEVQFLVFSYNNDVR